MPCCEEFPVWSVKGHLRSKDEIILQALISECSLSSYCSHLIVFKNLDILGAGNLQHRPETSHVGNRVNRATSPCLDFLWIIPVIIILILQTLFTKLILPCSYKNKVSCLRHYCGFYAVHVFNYNKRISVNSILRWTVAFLCITVINCISQYPGMPWNVLPSEWCVNCIPATPFPFIEKLSKKLQIINSNNPKQLQA